MNIQHLRDSLKVKWLVYYQKNRPWLVKLRVWGSYDGQRRPSSSFILATLSSLEPELILMFPFIIALNNDPDQIVAALGLNFNPDAELKSLKEPLLLAETNGNGNGVTQAPLVAKTNGNGNDLAVQIPSSVAKEVNLSSSTQASNLPSLVDESCHGKGSPHDAGLVLSILVVIGSIAVMLVGFSG